MKIGLAPTNSDYGPATADMAVEAEQRGYDSLWVGEHSHIPASRETVHPDGGDLPQLYWHMRDPFVSLATAAAATSTIKLAMGVCLVLEHEILDLAKSVATLDEVSGGRLLFGVGVGWNREELANVSNVPWAQRYNAMRGNGRGTATPVDRARSRVLRRVRELRALVGVPEADAAARPSGAGGLPGTDRDAPRRRVRRRLVPARCGLPGCQGRHGEIPHGSGIGRPGS